MTFPFCPGFAIEVPILRCEKLTDEAIVFIVLKNEDQYKKNGVLQAEITNIKKTYSDSLKIYEGLLDLSDSKTKTKLSEAFANQGHSGYSAAVTLALFNELFRDWENPELVNLE